MTISKPELRDSKNGALEAARRESVLFLDVWVRSSTSAASSLWA